MRKLWMSILLTLSMQCLAMEPDQALSPAQVVRFQLESLQQNNVDNDGIAATFRFASPANKRITGPLGKFQRLFDHPRYLPMLNHQHADITPVSNNGDQAVFDVELVDSDGSIHHYRFELSVQPSGACVDCWMTDAVMWAPRPGRSV